MAEATRVRPVEYYNPRPMILGLCFIWGIGVGFGINFFRAPAVQNQQIKQPDQQVSETARPIPSEIERRRQDIPNLAEVAPAPTASPVLKQTLEDVTVEPPAAILTTEGGLSGRTALPLQPPTSSSFGNGASMSTLPASPSVPSAPPPPIPDLTP